MAGTTAFGLPAIRNVGSPGHTWGPIGVLVLLQVFVFLITLNGSNIIPGNWSGLFNVEVGYLILSLVALGVFAAGNRVPLAAEGDVGWFLVVLVPFMLFTIFLLAEIFTHFGAAPTQVAATQRIQTIIFIAIFVGPTEELLFRVVIPPWFGKSWVVRVIGSSALFGVFHLPAYSVATGSVGQFQLASAVVNAFLFGILLYILYDGVNLPSLGVRYRGLGLGAAIGVHIGYDLTVLGAVGGLAVGASALGLTGV